MKSLVPFRRGSAPARAGEDRDPIEVFRREIDRMFEDFTSAFQRQTFGRSDGFLTPRMDVSETKNGLEIKTELPGVDEADVDVELADDVVTIRAERRDEREDETQDRRHHLREHLYGAFFRRTPLPFEADPDKVQATFKNGVLTLVIPRSKEAQAKTRKIAIKAG